MKEGVFILEKVTTIFGSQHYHIQCNRVFTRLQLM